MSVKQLFRNVASQWFLRILRLLVGTIVTIIVARVLGPENYGIAVSISVLSSPFNFILDPGLSQSVIRYVSVYYGSGKDYRPILAGFAIYRTIAGLAVALLFYLLAPLFASLIDASVYVEAFRIYSIIILLTSFTSVFEAYLYGINRVDLAVFYYSVGFIAGELIALLLVLIGLGVTGYILGHVAMPMVTLTLYIIKYRFLLRDLSRVSLSRALREFRTTIPLAASILVSQIASYAYTWLDKILVLSFLGTHALGLYTVALRFASIFEDLLVSIGQAIMPYYGVVYGIGGLDSLKWKVWRVSRILSLAFTPLLMIVAPLTPPLISLIYGESFAQSWTIAFAHLLYLAATGFTASYVGIALILEVRKAIITRSILVFVTSVLLEILLIELNLGSLGAVLGRDLGQIVGFVYMYMTLYVRRGLDFDVGLWCKSLLLGSILVLLLVYVIIYTPLLWPVWLCMAIIAYLLALKLFKLVDKEDMKILREIVPSKFSRLLNLIEKVVM